MVENVLLVERSMPMSFGPPLIVLSAMLGLLIGV